MALASFALGHILTGLGLNPHEFGFTKAILPSDASELRGGLQPDRALFPRCPAVSPVRGHQPVPEAVQAPQQDVAAYVELPLKDENGEYTLDHAVAQDVVAWTEQGPINDRTQEHLGASDVLVVQFRRLLKDQIERVRRNEDPMGVLRDPALIDSPEQRIPGNEKVFSASHSARDISNYYPEDFHKLSPEGRLYIEDEVDKYSPDREVLLELFRRAEHVLAKDQKPGG